MLRIWGRKNSINVQKMMWAVGELRLSHRRIGVGGRALPFGIWKPGMSGSDRGMPIALM
jgi:hypothetical protein